MKVAGKDGFAVDGNCIEVIGLQGKHFDGQSGLVYGLGNDVTHANGCPRIDYLADAFHNGRDVKEQCRYHDAGDGGNAVGQYGMLQTIIAFFRYQIDLDALADRNVATVMAFPVGVGAVAFQRFGHAIYFHLATVVKQRQKVTVAHCSQFRIAGNMVGYVCEGEGFQRLDTAGIEAFGGYPAHELNVLGRGFDPIGGGTVADCRCKATFTGFGENGEGCNFLFRCPDFGAVDRNDFVRHVLNPRCVEHGSIILPLLSKVKHQSSIRCKILRAFPKYPCRIAAMAASCNN